MRRWVHYFTRSSGSDRIIDWLSITHKSHFIHEYGLISTRATCIWSRSLSSYETDTVRSRYEHMFVILTPLLSIKSLWKYPFWQEPYHIAYTTKAWVERSVVYLATCTGNDEIWVFMKDKTVYIESKHYPSRTHLTRFLDEYVSFMVDSPPDRLHHLFLILKEFKRDIVWHILWEKCPILDCKKEMLEEKLRIFSTFLFDDLSEY